MVTPNGLSLPVAAATFVIRSFDVGRRSPFRLLELVTRSHHISRVLQGRTSADLRATLLDAPLADAHRARNGGWSRSDTVTVGCEVV